MQNINICPFSSFDNELQIKWQELESNVSSCYVFQRCIWLRHWQNSVGTANGVEPCIILIEDGSGSLAILPFGRQRVNGITLLVFLGGDQTDYHMPLYTDKGKAILSQRNVWNMVFKKLPRFDVFHVNKIPDHVIAAGIFPFEKGDVSVVSHAFAASMPLTWEAYLQNVPKRIKADTNRQIRRLEEKGSLQFRIIDMQDKDAQAVLEAFISQKRHRYQSTGSWDLLASSAVRTFYTTMPAVLGSEVYLQLSALFLGNEIIATHWGAFDEKRFYFLMPTFFSEYSQFSPGRLLLEKLLEWSIERKIAIFDFTVGGEEYKKIWCNREMVLYEIYLPVTVKGLLYMKILHFKEGLKKYPYIVDNVRLIKNRIAKLSAI